MKEFLQMAIRLGAEIYLNCSTSEVYSMASYKEGGVCESDALMLVTAESSQRTSYATGKLLTEFFMKEAVDNKQIKGCSIRFANVYSNDELLPEHIIPYTIDSFIHGNSIQLLANAQNTYRTFLHNQDSCDAVIALLETPEALDGSVYNVGTDEEILIPDLVRLIAKKMGKQHVNIHYEGERSADPTRRLLNTQKIRTRTKWLPKVTLDKGIDMCIVAKII
jgi:dTDP-glucose 4,6-dehydratase